MSMQTELENKVKFYWNCCALSWSGGLVCHCKPDDIYTQEMHNRKGDLTGRGESFQKNPMCGEDIKVKKSHEGPAVAWSVYMLRCDGRCLYTGIASDVARRMAEHAAGSPRGARFTRGFTSLELVYKACLGERSLATRAEARIKQLSRRRKEELVRNRPSAPELLELLGLAVEGKP